MASCAVPASLLLLLPEATGPESVARTRVAKEVEAEHKDRQGRSDGDESQTRQAIICQRKTDDDGSDAAADEQARSFHQAGIGKSFVDVRE